MLQRGHSGGLRPIFLGICLAFANGAGAADGDSSVTLGEIQVSGATGALPTKSVLSSVNFLGADMIENQNVGGVWQVFRQMPGVLITEFRQGTTAGKFSFRGFNGEGEINAVKLLIDGIPGNGNDGNMYFLDMLTPLDVQAVELVKGTNDPRYGLHAIAGNANVMTDIGGNYSKARVSYGSFNTREIQAGHGSDSGGFSQNYVVSYQGMDGYRDHADSEKYALGGKWFYSPDGDRTRVGFIARTFRQTADEPGYLTLAESRQDPTQSMPRNASDGGERDMTQLGAFFDRQINDRLFWSNKLYLNDIRDLRWVRFSQQVSQQERVVDETHYGLASTLSYRPAVSGIHSLALEGGVDGQWQDNVSQRYRTSERRRLATTRDQAFTFDIYGAYVQAVARLSESFKIVPALRVDKAFGSYTNRLNGQVYPINDYGLIPQPKLSALYTVAPGWNLYANYGRSFQVGVGSSAYKVGQASDLDPSINDGWEAGIKFSPVGWFDGRLAAWEQVASNEARRKLNDPANASENIGKTRRRGFDVEARFKPAESTTLWLSYAFQQSKILQPESSAPETLGKEIDHVPRHIFAAGADYRLRADLRLSLWANAQSDYYLERANTRGKYGDFVLLNVSAAYDVSPTVALEFQVRNLTDQFYEYVWWDSDNNQSLHSPGDGRALYGAVRLKF